MCVSEEWKQIVGYQYSISSLGRIRNNTTNKYLKVHLGLAGYATIGLYRNGVKRTFDMHHLMMTYFGPKKPSSKHTVNHKDGNKHNFQLTNLEWATNSEQGIHAYRIGLSKPSPSFGSKHGKTKLTEHQVLEIRMLWDVASKKNRKRLKPELAELYSITVRNVETIVYRERWNHI